MENLITKDEDQSPLSIFLTVYRIWSKYSVGSTSSYNKQALVVVLGAAWFTEVK